MLTINIDKTAAVPLMVGLIVLVTGVCFFMCVGSPDLLDAIRNAIYEDRLYFEAHRDR